jgi:splicing factor 1
MNAYTLLFSVHLKIEENSRMLRTGDLGIPFNPSDRYVILSPCFLHVISLPPLSRSPSPEPIYSHDGKRLNTREVRVRKRLEDERHDLIQKAIGLNADYKPPADYKYDGVWDWGGGGAEVFNMASLGSSLKHQMLLEIWFCE